VAIKISNLEQISQLYSQKDYYYKDLHLDFTRDGNFSPALNRNIEGNDVQVDYDESAIKNSLRNLFNTRPGQRFLFPKYGLDLNQYLFEAVSEFNGQIIGENIVTSIKNFEPRVVVRRCDVVAKPDDNEYDITIIVEIPILNTNASINMLLDARNKSFILVETSRNR
jgi:phage baseplate assembly protein W